MAEKREWRGKAEWDRSDYLDEIASFMAKGERERRRGVDALWLTDASYEAHTKLQPLLSNEQSPPPYTLDDITRLERFKGKDVHLVADL